MKSAKAKSRENSGAFTAGSMSSLDAQYGLENQRNLLDISFASDSSETCHESGKTLWEA